MNPIDNDIQELLVALHRKQPLSHTFRVELAKALHLELTQPKQHLFTEDHHLNFVWFSIDCWVAEHHTLLSGQQEVVQFYGPNQILTDPHAFLSRTRTTSCCETISGTRLLKITYEQFKKLRSYMETTELVQQYLLQQSDHIKWRLKLLREHDREKVAVFANSYPISQLPGHLCASFLRMTPSRYSAAKTQYLQNKR